MFGEAVAATPKQGGSARFGLAHGATTDTLDPAGYPDTGTQVPFWGAMSNSLTEVDAKGNITADLVESMEPADGAKTWVLQAAEGRDLPQRQELHRRGRHRLLPLPHGPEFQIRGQIPAHRR